MSDTITMTIPAVRSYLRLPRVAIAGIATRSGFSFDEVESLRLAIGEVCQVLVDGVDSDDDLVITFDVGERGSMTVDVTAERAPQGKRAESKMSQRLIAASVGTVEQSEDGRTITFRKVAEEDDDD